MEPEGAVIFTRLFSLGDETVSTLELWGAEYQESNAVLVSQESLDRIRAMALRERCPIDIVGTVTGQKNVSSNCSHINKICAIPKKNLQTSLVSYINDEEEKYLNIPLMFDSI